MFIFGFLCVAAQLFFDHCIGDTSIIWTKADAASFYATDVEKGKVFSLFLNQKKWDDAKQVCDGLQNNGSLVQIPSAAINEWLYNLTMNLTGEVDVWLGGKLDAKDGTSFGEWTAWAPHHPNRLGGADCLLFLKSGYWTDVSCRTNRKGACETKSANGGSIYSFTDDAMTWFNARDHCNTNGSTMIKIEDEAENEQLSQMVHHFPGDPVWLGGHDQYEEGEWLWLDKSSISSWNNWNSFDGEPDDVPGKACLTYKPGEQYKWWDRWCGQNKYFICQEENVSPTAPEGVWSTAKTSEIPSTAETTGIPSTAGTTGTASLYQSMPSTPKSAKQSVKEKPKGSFCYVVKTADGMKMNCI